MKWQFFFFSNSIKENGKHGRDKLKRELKSQIIFWINRLQSRISRFKKKKKICVVLPLNQLS